ncbi:SCO7613 C-terminal domain-containing membrane protein [Nocardioides sp. B-3]|uniref:SCO7613 C-terminal domain-containing membrane protein n=1 Tax=Nocardioides sp. B-3 TaxID=2895565 RepID=UPI00215319D7|nr:hypothetical protein [Nocardioides sp. B-3]UUZ59348.1 hypothetical protein LP418_26465 [Nocardioides sp. B-3]
MFGLLEQVDEVVAGMYAAADRARVTVPPQQPPSTVAPAPVHRPAMSSATVPKILLGLGALCLLVAAVVFPAVARSLLGVEGRTVVLAAFTAVAGALTVVVARRDLRAGAESLAAVTLGIFALVVNGAWRSGWLGAIGEEPFPVVAGLTVAVAGVASARWAASTPVGVPVSGEVIAVLGPVAAAPGIPGTLDAGDAVASLAALSLFTIGVVAGLRLELRILAIGSLIGAAVAWLAPVFIGVLRLDGELSLARLWGDLEVWPLVVAAVPVAAVALPRRLPAEVRVAAASTAVLLGTLVPVVAVFDESPTRIALVELAVVAAYAAALRDASARPVEVGVRGSVGDRRAGAERERGPAGRRRGGRPGAQRAVEPRAARPGRRTRRPPDPAAAAARRSHRDQRHRGDPDALRRSTGSLDDRARHGCHRHFVPPPAHAVRRPAGRRRRCRARRGGRARRRGQQAATGRPRGVSGRHDRARPPGRPRQRLGHGRRARRDHRGSDRRRSTWQAGRGRCLPRTPDRRSPDLDDRPPGRAGHRLAGPARAGGARHRDRRPARGRARGGGRCRGLRRAPGRCSGPERSSRPGWRSTSLSPGSSAPSLRCCTVTVEPSRGRASVLLTLAQWVRLEQVGVDTVEAYTLPLAVVLLVVGTIALLRGNDSSMATLSPGLGLALVPSLLLVLVDPVGLRAVVLGLACIVLVAIGLARGWAAPLWPGPSSARSSCCAGHPSPG